MFVMAVYHVGIYSVNFEASFWKWKITRSFIKRIFWFLWFPFVKPLLLLVYNAQWFHFFFFFWKTKKKNKDSFLNPLSGNITKWSNTFKQFVGKLPTNCLNVFDHFVELAPKGLKPLFHEFTIITRFIKKDISTENSLVWKNHSPLEKPSRHRCYSTSSKLPFRRMSILKPVFLSNKY